MIVGLCLVASPRLFGLSDVASQGLMLLAMFAAFLVIACGGVGLFLTISAMIGGGSRECEQRVVREELVDMTAGEAAWVLFGLVFGRIFDPFNAGTFDPPSRKLARKAKNE